MENNIKIQILPPEEARRIAAGEVIDRPAALVREFLDNAIDAGSENITVSIEEGGCKKVEVSDDGTGMNREDLELCHLTHATSKIRGLNDLDTAVTLGFRGEALAAASSVARLEIITSTDGREAYLLTTGPGENYPPKIELTRRTKGTTAKALNLFENIPARKRFLKREGSEGMLCRQVFMDKALAFNSVNFRYLQDGKLKDFLPGVQSRKERFSSALQIEIIFLHEINVIGDGFSAAIVIGGPDLFRNDRRQLYVFANGRRVQDFSLIQAMEYGTQGWFPNGTHPVGAVYVEIDPSLADFNIHPAKREVRFRDPGAIHHVVSGGIKNFFHRKTIAEYSFNEKKLFEEDSRILQRSFPRRDVIPLESEKRRTQRDYKENSSRQDAKTPRENYELRFSNNVFEFKQNMNDNYNNANKNFASFASSRLCENSYTNEPATVYGEARYAGRVFGLFILIEWGEKLYIIDQHAAHERILYNKFLANPIPKQELLSPIPFNTESNEEDSFLETKRDELLRLGIEIKKDENGNSWNIEALPADWRMTDAATVKEILELRMAGENMAHNWAASLCCHAAIKDGDYPDDETAFALGKEALELPDPHCPHGRPVWTEISRKALNKAVKRE